MTIDPRTDTPFPTQIRLNGLGRTLREWADARPVEDG